MSHRTYRAQSDHDVFENYDGSDLEDLDLEPLCNLDIEQDMSVSQKEMEYSLNQLSSELSTMFEEVNEETNKGLKEIWPRNVSLWDEGKGDSKVALPAKGSIGKSHVHHTWKDTQREVGKFECDICGNVYTTKGAMRRHRKTHGGKTFKCWMCDKAFTRVDSLRRHAKEVHNMNKVGCSYCSQVFSREHNLMRHLDRSHKR